MGASACSKVTSGDKRQALVAGKKVDEKTLSFVAGVSLFSYLEFEEHDLIARCLEECEYADKEDVVTEGDEGDTMYIIQSGKAVVNIKDAGQVAKLSAGDYFGEYSLLWDQPRSATITAKGKMKCLSLSREHFDTLELKDSLHFPKRAVLNQASGDAKEEEGKGKKKKKGDKSKEANVTDEEVNTIADALSKNQKLNEAMDLSREMFEAMARSCRLLAVKQGDIVIKQGDKVAEEMYIVKDGELSVSIMDGGSKSAVTVVGQKTTGDSFGELALLLDAPRGATILAVSEVNLYTLHRTAFRSSMRAVQDNKSKDVIKFLGTVQCLGSLLGDEKTTCAEAFLAVKFEAGEEVFRKGDEVTEFMILDKGELCVKGGKKSDAEERYNKSGQLVACEPFLLNGTYKATMIAGLEGALLYALDRDSFQTLLSGVEPVIRQSIGMDDGGGKKKKKTTIAADDGARSLRFPPEMFKELKRTRILGCGGFGTVWMVEQAGAGGCCAVGKGADQMAMKCVMKGLVAKTNSKVAIQNERKVMAAMVDNPMTVRLHGTFKDDQNVYFLMDMATMNLQRAYLTNKLFGKPEHASFHIASLACALEALHVRRIAYRDVKPENILLDPAGRVKLCDMGLAKMVPGVTYSVVGVPEYCAPEVFSGQGYSPTCDWWALGVLIFELMTGGNPFNKGNDIMSTMTAVKKGFAGEKGKDGIPYFLEKKHPDAVAIIKETCQKQPKKRLPVGKTGHDDLAKFKAHAWFEKIDWEGVAAGTIEKGSFVPPADLKPAKEPHPEDLPEEVRMKETEKCDWDEDF